MTVIYFEGEAMGENDYPVRAERRPAKHVPVSRESGVSEPTNHTSPVRTVSEGTTTVALLDERDSSHGDARVQMTTAGRLWGAYLRARGWVDPESSGGCVSPAEVDMMMVLLKVSRTAHGDATFADHYDDMHGYTALAREHALPPKQNTTTVSEPTSLLNHEDLESSLEDDSSATNDNSDKTGWTLKYLEPDRCEVLKEPFGVYVKHTEDNIFLMQAAEHFDYFVVIGGTYVKAVNNLLDRIKECLEDYEIAQKYDGYMSPEALAAEKFAETMFDFK